MKRYLLHICVFTLFILLSNTKVYSQNKGGKLYTMSGIGFAFPVGETNDYFKPKFSTTLGLNIDVGKQGFFLYPQLDFHAYSFFQQVPSVDGGGFLVNKSRATTYLLNMAVGYRKSMNKIWAFYGYAGSGAGFILNPHIKVEKDASTATLHNRSITMPILEMGIGGEYNLGDVCLFLETSFMHGLNTIQGRPFNSVPICFGIKPDIRKLFKKKKR
jgi:hypothetical protein